MCLTLTPVQYMSQETSQNPWIHYVGNPQFICGIIEDIHEIVKGYLRICRRASAQSELSKASAELRKMITMESPHGIPRIVKG